MTDLDRAIAAAREAAGMALFDDSPKAKHACVEALHDLLAALAAAQKPALYVRTEQLADPPRVGHERRPGGAPRPRTRPSPSKL